MQIAESLNGKLECSMQDKSKLIVEIPWMFEWGKIKCYWIELQTQETPGLDTKVR